MASNSIGDAFVTLRSDDSRLQPDIEAQLTKALGPVVAKGAKILAGLFVGKQVVGVARAGIAELAEAEKQEALLGAQILATGGAAGITQQHIQDLAAANLDLAATDDEVTLAAERVLLQFSRITAAGGIFDETLRSAQDLAVASGQDLPAASRVLGLSLQDPLKATRLLRGESIALNAAQQEQIKQFVASGNILGAQRVILDQVARQVGGVAEAYGDTLAGDLQRAQEELENTKASLLEGAVPAIQLFANASTVASEAIQELPIGLRSLASGAVALAGFAPTLLTLRGTLLQTSAAKATLSAADATGAGSAAANTAAIEANTTALLLNVPAAERAIFAQNQLAIAEGRAAAGATAATGATRGLASSIALFAIPAVAALAVAEGLAQAFHLFGQSSESIDVNLKGQVPTVEQFTDALRDTHGILGAVTDLNDEYANQLLGQSTPAAKNFADALDATGRSSADLRDKIAAKEQAEREATAATQGMTLAELDAAQAEEARTAAMGDRLDAISGQVSAERALEQAQRGVSSAQRSLADAQRDLNEALQGASAEDRAKAEVSLRQAQLGTAAAAKTVADEEAILARLRSGSSGTIEELTSQEERLADARAASDRAQRSLAELEREARINARRGIAQTREQRLAIEDAARSAQDAAKNTAAEEAKLAQLRSPASVAAITEQELRLEQARLAQQTAAFAVTDAESALQAVQAQGTAQDEAVIDGRQRVRDAQAQVTDAYLSQVDAAAALANANGILAGKEETAATKARNLRTALAASVNLLAPGTAERKNLEDQIILLDRLLGDAKSVGDVLGGINFGSGAQGFSGKNLIKGATGFMGTVSRPTLGLFGEGQGAEDLLAVPHSQGGIQLGSQVTVSVGGVHFHGVVPSAAEAFRTGQAVGAGVADVLTRHDVRLAKKIA